MKSIYSIFVLVAHLSLALSHSWLACSDYKIDTTEDARVFNPSKCVAYGRNYKNGHKIDTFGLDTGYDYRPTNAPLCKYPLAGAASSFYSNDAPMARYAPGQRVCLAWPSKNHVAATCNNPYIPDSGLKIYMSAANPTADAAATSAMRLVHDFGANSRADEFKGFQNCPNFCANADKSTCSGCFNIPSDVQVGAMYSFVWSWAFNGPNDLYSSCWEAQIVSGGGDGGNTQSTTGARPVATTGARPVATTGARPVATTGARPVATTGNENQDGTTEDQQPPQDATTEQPAAPGATTASQLSRSTTAEPSNNAVNAGTNSCSKNEDCASGVCEVGGVCQQEKGLGLAEILAIAFGATACLAITVAVVVVLFRYKLKRLPYV